MHRLIDKLKERFPHLGETHDNAIVAITTEFFQPTIGEFLNQHKEAVTHLKKYVLKNLWQRLKFLCRAMPSYLSIELDSGMALQRNFNPCHRSSRKLKNRAQYGLTIVAKIKFFLDH